MSATTRKGRRVAAARYPYQARAVRGPGSDGPRGLAVNGLLPLIKLLTLLWFTILVIFNYQLYLDNELVYRRYRTIASLYRYRSTKYPPIWLLQAEIAVKARPLRCAAQSFSIALGLKRLALVRRSTAARFRVVSATHRRQRARRTMKLLVALSLFGAAAAVELTPDKRSSGVPSLAYIRSNALAHPAQLGRHDRWQDGLYQIPGALVRALQEDETCVGRRHGGLRGPPHEARR